MFFKTLEIQGFKSFADKTVLSFDSKMTAIVGSNGNGKSNISDALRWVMGEQGAKTLRGDKMEDVIFHGTETRKQMGFASVVLSIDNSDRTLGVNSDEVNITRKLYRTGESEYLINNEKTRLKDIQELLMGTGLGRDGYSIIGQGRVGEIVNSKGKERREIFDEAAGVSKFLHKKAEAERELTRAGDNILRLLDISKELEDRLPILEKQSEKAVKAKELIEQEKNLEISVSVAELQRIDKDLLELEDKILLNEGECEHYDREISELEEENEKISEDKLRYSVKIDELRALSDTVKDEIAAIDKDAAVMAGEIVHNKGRISVIEEQIINSEKSSAEFDEQINELVTAVADKKATLEASAKLINEKEKTLSEKASENEDMDTEYKALDKELGDLYMRQTEAKISLAQAESTAEDLRSQLLETQSRLENQDEQIADYRLKRRELRNALDTLTEEKSENENRLAGFSRLYISKKEKLEAADGEFQKLRREYDQKKSRFDVLSDVERNMAGYYGSVKAVITAAKAGKLSDIHGTIADIIHVEGKYSVAIEIALGASLQNIIVQSEETAKRCIRYLKETNAGRATFLPLTAIKGRELDEPDLKNEEGFLGLGHELVEYDAKYENIIKSALGKTVITDDIDTATFLAKKYQYRFRIVTLDGQVINAGGSFTGGSVKESAGIISRKQELQALEKELVTLRDTLELVKGSHSQLVAEINKMAIELEGYKEQISAQGSEEIRLTAEIGGIDNLIHQCEEQLDNAEVVIDKNKGQIAASEAVIAKYKDILAETEAALVEKNAIISEKSKELEAASEKRSELSAEITRLNLEILSTEKDIQNLEDRIKSVEDNKKNLGQSSDKLKSEIAELEVKNTELEAKINETKQKIDEVNKGYSDNQSEITKLLAENNKIEQRISGLNKEIREKMEQREKFATALVLSREKKSNMGAETDKIKGDLWDKYELTPSEAKEKAQPLQNTREAKNLLQDIRRKISALGNVNFAAIEEFVEVSDRYGVLSTQLDDLEKSKADLEKLIVNLTAEIKEKFLASFNEINLHFGKIFSEIFGGGKAHLELTDPDDILSSGIEIFAAPPGKLIKNLISLSGGEQTMVAITIYFAILLHRPTPFCMLDEVDAALDEANVVKYISYLKRFSNDTQLMVITHRRGTIEGCDVLYGVFMQEKGISKLLRQEIIDDLDLK